MFFFANFAHLSEEYFEPVWEILDLVEREIDVVKHGEADWAPVPQGQVHLHQKNGI
jgi:hypothetical protein